jgi:hypothetical protein
VADLNRDGGVEEEDREEEEEDEEAECAMATK